MTRATAFPLVLVLAGCASQPAWEPNPYTADQIARLLRGAVNPERILFDARRECVSFRMTPDIEGLLAGAGAPASFIAEIQGVCYRPVPARGA